MSEAATQILDQVLKLPASERADIARELLASIDGIMDPSVEAEWASEIERRAQLDDSTDRDWTDVRAEMVAKYGLK